MLFRKRLYSGFVVILFITSLIFSSLRSSLVVYAANGDAQWGKSVTPVTTINSQYYASATDSQNNIYAVGVKDDDSLLDLGNSVSVSGGSTAVTNPLFVKYNSSGQIQWARTAQAGSTAQSRFKDAVIDSGDNIYIVGEVSNAGTVEFGNGVTLTSPSASNVHAFLIKYNSSGVAQWVRNVSFTGNGSSTFSAIDIDSSDNIFICGSIQSSLSTYDFGNGVTIVGTSLGANSNPLVVRYDADGNAQWAYSTTNGSTAYSFFTEIALRTDGTFFVSGELSDQNTADFGSGVTATGGSDAENVVIVKYNYSGAAQWARTSGAGTVQSTTYYSLAVDSNGDVYAAGNINGTDSISFGNGVTLAGVASTTNPLLVKYNGLGETQWAKTMTAGQQLFFNRIAIDNSDHIYVGGNAYTSSPYDFGNSITVTTELGLGESQAILVQYNTAGTAQLARTTTNPTFVDSTINHLHIDSLNYVVMVGSIVGTGTYNFGNGVQVAGGGDLGNAFVVKYEGAGVVPSPTATPTPTSTPATSGSSSSPAPDGQRSTTDTPVCSDQAPGTPDLFQVTSTGRSSALVHFAPTPDPVSSYLISFGESPEAEGYSAQLDLGHVDGAVTYTLDFLKPSTIYYAKVRAGNGCMPGDWSRTIRFQTSTQASYFPGQYSPIQSAQVFGAVNQKPSSSKVVPAKLQTNKKSITHTAIPTPTSTFSKPWYQFW